MRNCRGPLTQGRRYFTFPHVWNWVCLKPQMAFYRHWMLAVDFCFRGRPPAPWGLSWAARTASSWPPPLRVPLSFLTWPSLPLFCHRWTQAWEVQAISSETFILFRSAAGQDGVLCLLLCPWRLLLVAANLLPISPCSDLVGTPPGLSRNFKKLFTRVNILNDELFFHIFLIWRHFYFLIVHKLIMHFSWGLG